MGQARGYQEAPTLVTLTASPGQPGQGGRHPCLTHPLGQADEALSRPDSQVGAGGADGEKGEHALVEIDAESVQVAHVLRGVEGHGPHLQIQGHPHAGQLATAEGRPLGASHRPVLATVELQRPDALLWGEGREALATHALPRHTEGPAILGAHFHLPVVPARGESTGRQHSRVGVKAAWVAGHVLRPLSEAHALQIQRENEARVGRVRVQGQLH